MNGPEEPEIPVVDPRRCYPSTRFEGNKVQVNLQTGQAGPQRYLPKRFHALYPSLSIISVISEKQNKRSEVKVYAFN